MKVLAIVLAFLMLESIFAEDDVKFSSKLYHEIAHSKPKENVILSPASIKSCIGLAYMGAEGDTAKEMHDVLQLSGESKEEVGQHFGEYMNKVKSSGVELKTANRVYLANEYEVAPNYNELTSKYFGTKAENVDFTKPETVTAINSWIEEQTNNKIKGMLTPESLDASTSAILINAIYFKATWQYKFQEDRTVDKNFHISAEQKVPVKTMHQTIKANYGNFPELDATGVELPYDKTNIRMLILLPNKVDGIATMEEKLKDVDVTKLDFLKSKIELELPKFKIEFTTSLNDALKNLGLKNMFAGDYSGMTTTKAPLKISDVRHKAFIEVDEQGTEAAAVTEIFMTRTLPAPRDLPHPFIVDHPFFFAIKDDDTVYFAGHISKF